MLKNQWNANFKLTNQVNEVKIYLSMSLMPIPYDIQTDEERWDLIGPYLSIIIVKIENTILLIFVQILMNLSDNSKKSFENLIYIAFIKIVTRLDAQNN